MKTGQRTALTSLFRSGYELLPPIVRVLALIGAAGHILFFVGLRVFSDYWESLGLRLVAAFAMLSMFPLSKHMSKRVVIFWYEFVLAATLPLMFNYFLLQNDANTYWSVSVMFAALPYGLMAAPEKSFLVYPLSVAAAALIYRLTGDARIDTGALLSTNVPAYFMVVLLGFIQVFTKYSYTQLGTERRRSESLLLNILPSTVADQLRRDEQPLSNYHPEASVLFADIVGFTPIAESQDPRSTVGLLNRLFSRFDDLVSADDGLEKIKTIGDGYMAVAGAPDPCSDHAGKAVRLAMDMVETVGHFNESQATEFAIRVGVATGPLVSGVIGKLKFAFDVWGATVNLGQPYGVDLGTGSSSDF